MQVSTRLSTCSRVRVPPSGTPSGGPATDVGPSLFWGPSSYQVIPIDEVTAYSVGRSPRFSCDRGSGAAKKPTCSLYYLSRGAGEGAYIHQT